MKSRKDINEWGGAGFSMSSSIFPMNRGGQVNRGGFGGAFNAGGPNMMYTYEIKPLNRILQQKPSKVKGQETIKLGDRIYGKRVNDKDGKTRHGVIIKIGASPTGALKFYVILDDKTNTVMKIDPTTATLVTGEYAIDPRNTMFTKDYFDMKRRNLTTYTNESYRAKEVRDFL